MHLTAAVHQFIDGGPLAHVVTLQPDGTPHVSLAWVGIEDGELVIGTLNDQPKLRNLRRDPRITLSFDSPDRTPYGLNEYLVIRGRARLTEGGAADLLQRLARIYLGPDVVFPGIADPPPGFVVRIAPERISGIGPWQSR